MKAQLSSPPATPIDWVALRVRPELAQKGVVVSARVWFEARAKAMAALGAGPDDVVVAPKPDPLAALFGESSTPVVTRDFAAPLRVGGAAP